MLDFFISWCIFLLAITLHVILHRILVKCGIVTFKSTIIFIIALICNALVLFVFPQDRIVYNTSLFSIRLPYSALTSNVLLMLIFILFFTGPFWGEESPSFKIIFLIRKHKRLSSSSICKQFSNADLIKKRLSFLVNARYIANENDVYIVLPKGKIMYLLIERYRKLLNWYEGG